MFAGLQQSVTPVSFDLAFESVLVCYSGCIFMHASTFDDWSFDSSCQIAIQ
jgi:hypothetical protein